MKILVEISDELFRRVQEVSRGSSISNFILASIENQLQLERYQKGDLIDLEMLSTNIPNIKEKETSLRKDKKKGKIELELLNSNIKFDNIVSVPLRRSIKDYYIWGQYNKFFPIKFALRYLALLQTKDKQVNLVEFQNKCAKEASKVKKILIMSDEKAQRKWGEAFSAGLPEDEEKSRSRFIHQFIGYNDSQGNSTGALADFGFVVIENNQIALSPSGLIFSQIKNPILDEDPFSPNLFSQEERQFLIVHIRTNIPTEWEGIKKVIQWIESGNDTPNSLNAKMATLEPKWTEKMVNTYRTGILARMYDLGFITRKKIGLNANYQVTDFGKSVGGLNDR